MSVNTTVPCPNTVHHPCPSLHEKVAKFLLDANLIGNKYDSDSDCDWARFLWKRLSVQPWLHTVDVTAGKSIRWSMLASLLYSMKVLAQNNIITVKADQQGGGRSNRAWTQEETLVPHVKSPLQNSCQNLLGVKLKGERLFALLIKLLLQHLCESPLQL